MMLDKNLTPYAAIGFEQICRDGAQMAVIAVRGRYQLNEKGELALDETQEIILADEYAGDPHRTPFLRGSDLIGFRPKADVTILGQAYAPENKPSRLWQAGIKVGAHSHLLNIHGPRQWEPQKSEKSWKLSETKPVDRVPLHYGFSAGGRIIGHPDAEADLANPLGVGVFDKEHTPEDTIRFAPCLEHPDFCISNVFEPHQHEGFYPIPPWWQARMQHLGTRDAHWLKEICPQYPKDFSYAHYQIAHPRLILKDYLKGDEKIHILNLLPNKPHLSFSLPAITPWAHYLWDDGREVAVRLNCDGFHLDLRGEGTWRIDLTWRAWMPICPRFWKIDLYQCLIQDAADLPVVGEDGSLREV